MILSELRRRIDAPNRKLLPWAVPPKLDAVGMPD